MDNRDDTAICGDSPSNQSLSNSDPSLDKDIEANGKCNGVAFEPIDSCSSNQHQSSKEGLVTYGIEDNPPIHLGILLGLQVCFHFISISI